MITFLLIAACSSPGPTTIGHLGAYAHGEMGVGLSVARVAPTSSNTTVTVETRTADGGSWADARTVEVDWAGPSSLDVALVADNSGSESGHLDDIQTASLAFLEQVLGRGGADRVGLVRVSTQATILSDLTDDATSLQSAVDGLYVANGWTALWDGVRVGNEVLEDGATEQADQVCANQSLRSIVVFTDGADNNSAGEHETSLVDDGINTSLDDLRGMDVHGAATALYAVGIGSDVDATSLQDLADSNGGRYSAVDGYDELLTALDDTAVELGGEVPVCFQPASCEDDEARVTVEVDDGGSVETTTFTLSYAASNCGCTLTQGYWKNHESAWPVSELQLGDVDYDQSALLVLLRTPVRGDVSLTLAHQLIAAKLNVAAGADDGDIYVSIDAADAWLTSKGGTLPLGKKGDATATELASLIDDWNNGGTGPGHCD
jgi:Mg-chelatase subunit ChlD